jgi:chemotaxis protein MotA
MLKPDLATLAGIGLAAGGILGGLFLEKGQLSDIVQVTAALIVCGGTVGAVLITNPLHVVMRALGAARHVLLEPSEPYGPAIEEIIAFAAKSRRNGIVSLEQDAEAIKSGFLKKALNLAVDGADLQVLRHMMETELEITEHSLESEAKVWESAGGYAPTIGIIGAVMGLIQVMKHLEDIREVGHGIAVAFVATVYGVGAANILLLPVANKLRFRARQEIALREMMLEGVIAIVEGLNPKIIRMKLESFTEGEIRRKPKAPANVPANAPPAKGKGGPVAA